MCASFAYGKIDCHSSNFGIVDNMQIFDNNLKQGV